MLITLPSPVSLLVDVGHTLGYSRLIRLNVVNVVNPAPTNGDGIKYQECAECAEPSSRQVGAHPSCHSEINPDPTGNRAIMTKKPDTESTFAQGS